MNKASLVIVEAYLERAILEAAIQCATFNNTSIGIFANITSGHFIRFSELQPIEMIWANVKDGAIIHYTIENSNTYLLALDKKLREADAVEEIGNDVFSDSAMDSPTCGNDDCSESSDDNEANNDV
ncbi:hypothetical protein AC1031_007839 [Aphanomyces cochlioides]|nr:hypothetical protein AC1031_007839 [Aphanomyces cochlioides]